MLGLEVMDRVTKMTKMTKNHQMKKRSGRVMIGEGRDQRKKKS